MSTELVRKSLWNRNASRAAGSTGLSLHRLVDSTALVTVLSILGFVLLWWLIATHFIRDEVLLPSPAQFVHRFDQLATGSTLWNDLKVSCIRAVLGWAAGVVAGVGVGILMGTVRPARLVLDPFIAFGRPIPPLAFAPLLIVWFGIGEISKEIVVFVGVFPVMVIATTSALRGVEQDWKRAALTLGASRLYLLRRVVLPATLPEVITAMRVASGLAWGSLVAAEMIASNNGLGFMILQASQFVDSSSIVVGIFLIGCLAFTSDRLLRSLDRHLAGWRGRSQ